MGRRNLRLQRREEILDACEDMVFAQGLAAATPAAVARKIGLDRTTVHHYFRSQAELMAGLANRVVDAYLADLRALAAGQQQQLSVNQALDLLLSTSFSVPRYDRLCDEFAAYAHHDAEIGRQQLRLCQHLEAACVELLSRALPHIKPARVRQTAYAVYALIEGAYGLHSVGFAANRLTACKTAALTLVDHLQADPSAHRLQAKHKEAAV